MTEYPVPISQVEIESELTRLIKLLEEETDAYAVVAVDQAKKDARYKMEWAKSYLAADGSVKERESWADYQQADTHHDLKIAEALVKAKQQKMNTLRTSMDALRTLAANVRAQT